MFVKPSMVPDPADPGRKMLAEVRDPDLRDILPREGRDVPRSDYWIRRIDDGSVHEAQPPQPAPETKKEAG